MNQVKNKILESSNLTMRFGGVTALDSLNLHVNEGEVLGLLGPNGSGKTTFFNVITGLYRATSGNVTFRGKDLADATAASTLLPLYALCAKILGQEKLVAELAQFQKKHMAHTNAQGWVPNSRSDQKMWAGHERDGSALQDLEIGENGDMLISALKRECAENTAWPNLSAVRLGHWPLVAIACRRNRTPVPPQLWMGII